MNHLVDNESFQPFSIWTLGIAQPSTALLHQCENVSHTIRIFYLHILNPVRIFL